MEDFSDYQARLDSVSDIDMAWFGGWLSADGCILASGGKGPVKIRFTICDKDPLDKFSILFGNSVSGPIAPSGLGKTPRYYWQISGSKARLLIKKVYPWLSDRYKERADKALASWMPREHPGRKLTPETVAAIKAALAIDSSYGSGKRLARQFNVTDGMICHIKNGRLWKD